MKKHLPLFLFFACTGIFSFAQTTVPNGDFENWVNIGQAKETPSGWHSNKDGGGFASLGPQTCFRDSNAYSGSWCVKVQTGTAFGNVVNGSCATGIVIAPSTNKADGYIADTGTVRQAFTGRPDSIVFWYKYTQQDTDYPAVDIRLHTNNTYSPEVPSNGNHPDSSENIIGRALWNGPKANQLVWKRVALPMVYVNNNTPQYIFVTMTSSGNQLAGAQNSTLWVDDMQAVYNGPSGISTEYGAMPKVFYHEGLLMADLSNNPTGMQLQLINAGGQIVLERPLVPNSLNSFNPGLPAGLYVFHLSSNGLSKNGKVAIY